VTTARCPECRGTVAALKLGVVDDHGVCLTRYQCAHGHTFSVPLFTGAALDRG
jgi:hypothetical protein